MQIEPIKNNNNTITIVYSFNDTYSMYFSTALKSLIENLILILLLIKSHFYY